jgi:hypothetical protein
MKQYNLASILELCFNNTNNCIFFPRWKDNYTNIRLFGKQVGLHVIVFVWFNNYEPPVVDHKCNNKTCINPKHLQASNLKNNMLRGYSKIALLARKEKCNKGHDFKIRTRLRLGNRTISRYCPICQYEAQKLK